VDREQVLSDVAPKLVALITSRIRTTQQRREDWRYVKKEIEPELARLLGVDADWPVKAYQLLAFDLDEERQLCLLNYTPGAHNVLHDVANGEGWTSQLKQMRGLLFSFGEPGRVDQCKLVSCGFEKFFNRDEVPSTMTENLPMDEPFLVRRKEDGAMVEFFEHGGEVSATTRGRIVTPYVQPALDLFGESTFYSAQRVARGFGVDLLSLVVEFIHPISKVHVDYDGWSGLYLLAAYDTDGRKVDHRILHAIRTNSELNLQTRMPHERAVTLRALIKEMGDRGIHNTEGWVASVKDELIKFKYETYIGMMVAEKLSYRYVMNQMRNGRCQRMFHCLPEELREEAWFMVKQLEDMVQMSTTYKPLYTLHGEREKGRDSFRQICREFWKELSSDIQAGTFKAA